MKEKLNESRISWIFYHLNHHLHLTDAIRERFVFNENSDSDRPRIIFLLSGREMSETKKIDGIPVLYPVKETGAWFVFDTQGNLIFQHDLLKSIFYLLSGYQEMKISEKDHLGRFPYKYSIQYKLEIIGLPVVNYYFRVLSEGIAAFCDKHHIPFMKRQLWGEGYPYGFLLTHDVDRVDKWTFHLIKLRIKQLLGMTHANLSRSGLLDLLLTALRKYITRDNPYWSFEWLKTIEKKHGFVSTWFFLSEGIKHIDAYYSLEEDRIVRLIQRLGEGDEIGLHASYRTMNNTEIMNAELARFHRITGIKPAGIRQHWLRFKYPDTLRIQEGLGFMYDSSWMFAEHLGWRNSYCLPFRPYDIERERMMDIWEIPLCSMDNTPFKYHKLNVSQARQGFKEILEQVQEFKGVFVMLWHNHYFNEEEVPGLKNLYLDLLEQIHFTKPESVLPARLIERLRNL